MEQFRLDGKRNDPRKIPLAPEKTNAFLSVIPFFSSLLDRNLSLLSWYLNRHFSDVIFSDLDLLSILDELVSDGIARVVNHENAGVAEYNLHARIEIRIQEKFRISKDVNFRELFTEFCTVIATSYYTEAAQEDNTLSYKGYLFMEIERHNFNRCLKVLLDQRKSVDRVLKCITTAHRYFHQDREQEHFCRRVLKYLDEQSECYNEHFWRTYHLTLNELIEQLIESGQNSEVAELINSGLAKLTPHENRLESREWVRFYVNWTRLLMKEGDFARVVELLTKAESFIYENDDLQLIEIWNKYITYEDQTNSSGEEALKYCSKIRYLAKKKNDRLEEAGALITLAILMLNDADTVHVESLFQEAMHLYSAVGGKLDQDGRLHQIIHFLIMNGDLEIAESLIRQQLRLIMKDKSAHDEGAELLSSLGYVFSLDQKPLESAEYFEKALGIYEKLEDETKGAWIHLLLCEAYGLTEDEDKAILHGQEAIKLYGNQENEELLMDCYNELGWALLIADKFEESEIIYLEALLKSRKLNDLHIQAWANFGLGEVYRLTNQNYKAFQHWKEAVRLKSNNEPFEQEYEANFIDAFVFAMRKIGRNGTDELEEILLGKFQKTQVNTWIDSALKKLEGIDGKENEFD